MTIEQRRHRYVDRVAVLKRGKDIVGFDLAAVGKRGTGGGDIGDLFPQLGFKL